MQVKTLPMREGGGGGVVEHLDTVVPAHVQKKGKSNSLLTAESGSFKLSYANCLGILGSATYRRIKLETRSDKAGIKHLSITQIGCIFDDR